MSPTVMGRNHHNLLVAKMLMIVAIGAAGAALPARADSTQATCILSRHDHTIPIEKGPCSFSQRQGNVNVRLGDWAFSFPSGAQNKTYQRRNTKEGIRFNREGQYTLQVLWK